MTIATLPIINQRYILKAKIGSGGMGAVYQALDRLTQQRVALKRVEATQLTFSNHTSDLLLALAQEFRILAGLNHPHIVSVQDYGFDTLKHPFYTMEFLEQAQTIRDYGSPLPIHQKTRLLIQTLQALIYLHRRGIIHRDLKPANILVTPDHMVRVMDFGLALQPDNDPATTYNVGTIDYMAPELFADEPASFSSDLYAFGILMYELFIGTTPFGTGSIAHTVHNIIHLQPDTSSLSDGLADLIQSLLVKTAAERLNSAEEVMKRLCFATGVEVPSESYILRESFLQASTFVGREKEISTLQNALQASKEGKNQCWLIGGESGVGKTRLLDEIRAFGLVSGALVLRGQAIVGGGLPQQLWRDIARRLVVEVSLSDIEASILKAIVPDIQHILNKPVADAPALTYSEEQFRLKQTLVDLLKRVPHPLLMLLEDLQWAGDSLSILAYLIDMKKQFRHLLIVGTFRDDEAPDLVAQLSGSESLQLTRLTKDAIAQLAQRMLGEVGQQNDLVSFIQEQTEGNVFFMIEALRILADRAGSLGAIMSRNLPTGIFGGGIQATVKRRLDLMPAEYQALLQTVAVAGRNIDLQLLAHWAKNDQMMQRFLTVGSAIRLFDLQDSKWQFSHDKLREGVLISLDQDLLTQVHTRVAEAIEGVYAQDRAYIPILIHHWQQANRNDRELAYLVPYVSELMDGNGNMVVAEKYVKRGLTLTDDPQITIPLRTNWAAIKVMKKTLEEAQHIISDTLEMTKEHPMPLEIARLYQLLGRIWHIKRDYSLSFTYFHKSLSMLVTLGNKTEIANCLNKLGALEFDRGNFSLAEEYHQQSLIYLNELGAKRGISYNLNNLGIIYYTQGKYEQAKKYYQQSLEIHYQTNHKLGIAAVLNNLGEIEQSLGNYQEAMHYYQQSIDIELEMNNSLSIASILSNLGIVAMNLQDSRRSENYFMESLLLYLEIGDKNGIAIVLLNMGNLAYSNENYATCEQLYRQSLEIAREIGDILVSAHALMELSQYYFEQKIDEKPYLVESLSLSIDHAIDLVTLGILITIARGLIRMGKSAEAHTIAQVVAQHETLSKEMRDKSYQKLAHELEQVNFHPASHATVSTEMPTHSLKALAEHSLKIRFDSQTVTAKSF